MQKDHYLFCSAQARYLSWRLHNISQFQVDGGLLKDYFFNPMFNCSNENQLNLIYEVFMKTYRMALSAILYASSAS